jgi:hypothetical protein
MVQLSDPKSCFAHGYIIPPPRIRWWKRISPDRILGIAALVVSLAAAIFSALQYRAANTQQSGIGARDRKKHP